MQQHYPIIIAIIMSFIISLILGLVAIPWLRQIKAGQSIREDGPQSHMVKAGTPTMGGLFFIAAMVITMLLVGEWNTDTMILIGATLLFGGIGFIDDFIKVVLKRNLGLRAYQKLALQIVIAIAIAVYQVNVSTFGTAIYIPFADMYLDFGILYVPFVVFFVVAMVNSVNLTDGLDGLASGVCIIVCIFFAITAVNFGYEGIGIFAGAISGSCLGFLKYNIYPAKVFMGDTGSLALGGAISAIAILTNSILIIPIVGGIFLAEAISVILQVLYYKRTKKRLFKMAPLHHHFEMCGWREKKVVGVFWSIAFALSVLGGFILW